MVCLHPTAGDRSNCRTFMNYCPSASLASGEHAAPADRIWPAIGNGLRLAVIELKKLGVLVCGVRRKPDEAANLMTDS